MVKKAQHERPLAQNRKASHDYYILDTIEAGIALTGTEIKSVRAGRLNLKDGFAKVLLGVAQGKHNYDKRETIKRRDQEREIRRTLKNYS